MPENMHLPRLEHHPHASFAMQLVCVVIVQGLTMVVENEVEEQNKDGEMQLPDMKLDLVVEEAVHHLQPLLDAKHVWAKKLELHVKDTD